MDGRDDEQTGPLEAMQQAFLEQNLLSMRTVPERVCQAQPLP